MLHRCTRQMITLRLAAVAAVCAVVAVLGCELPQRQQPSEPLGVPEPVTPQIGPAQVSPEQLQSEIEVYADRFVNAFSQAMDQLSRQHPDARNVLHTVKLATASGAYTIAAGQSPTAAALDMIVQVTLLRNSLNRVLIPRILDGDAGPLTNVLERYEREAWRLSERILTEPQREELRLLIDAWLENNPDQIYVAGVRLSDFSRLRPTAERPPNSVFSLLRLDPFASLDPTTREIEQARLLTERIFFYTQRMPQLLTWRAEQIYYTILGAKEAETLLANINDFTTTSKSMSQSVEELRTLIPDQTGEAVRAFSEALIEQREATVAALDSQQERAGQLVDRIDLAVNNLQEANADVQSTLTQVNEVGGTLTTAASSVADAGRAWEETVLAVKSTADAFKSDAPPDPNAEPVEFKDVAAALDQMHQTAVELRLLLQDLTASQTSEELNRSVATSLAETRRSMEGLTNYIMWRIVIVVAAILVAAIIYRLISSRIAAA